MRDWRTKFRLPAIAVALAGLIAYTVFAVNQSAQSQTTVLGPTASGLGSATATASGVYTTSAIQIIAANPTRKALMICNPSKTTTTWIAPLPMVATTNGNGSIPLFPINFGATVAVQSSLDCFNTPILLPAGGGIGAAWNAISETTAVPPTASGIVTIFEYN